jgi:hypothetical protein
MIRIEAVTEISLRFYSFHLRFSRHRLEHQSDACMYVHTRARVGRRRASRRCAMAPPRSTDTMPSRCDRHYEQQVAAAPTVLSLPLPLSLPLSPSLYISISLPLSPPSVSGCVFVSTAERPLGGRCHTSAFSGVGGRGRGTGGRADLRPERRLPVAARRCNDPGRAAGQAAAGAAADVALHLSLQRCDGRNARRRPN